MDEKIHRDHIIITKKILSQVELRSEMAQEIISRKPGFLEKWGLLIFLGILLLLFISTWFVTYPDIIETRATLTAANAPKEIVVRQEGRLVKLFARNKQQVNESEILGWIESTGDHKEVLELSVQLDCGIHLLQAQQLEKASSLFNRKYNDLGEIQREYQQFVVAWQLYNDYMVNGFYERKRAMLQNDIHTLDNTRQTIQRQKELTEQDVKLAAETYNMNEWLAGEKVLSKEEFRSEKSKFVNKQMAIPQLEASLLSNETEKRNKLKELDQLDHDVAQQKTNFQQALLSLKSAAEDWQKKYVLRSPVNGQVSFIIPIQENQFMQTGKLLGYINPADTRFYAEVNLPQNNFGKIDTGLKVQLRFDAYPYQEVGFVDGTLQYISNVASDSGFLATVRLDNGLITNNQKPIQYKSGLKAQAIIITKNMRLLQRLYYKLVKSTSVGTK